MSSEEKITSHNYSHWLGEMKSRVLSAHSSAARSVNRELIQLYWDIGRAIVEKQEAHGWGASVVDQLSKDLQREFPRIKGFSARNLRDMKRFFSIYSNVEIWRQAVAKLEDSEVLEYLKQLVSQIPWGHNLLILSHLSDVEERLYYLRATEKLGWSRKVLLNQIKGDAYSRSLTEGKSHNFPLALPEHIAGQAEEALKSAYNLEFLGISRQIKERDLENSLIENLKEFILELGYGFCFIGRQHRLRLGEKEYFVDLLFYHRFLKCLVAIELKVGEFEPEFAGKMDFYLNLLNENERQEGDNQSIGIILCAEKDDLEVEFALKSKGNPIGVAEYQLKRSLPKELKGKIPTQRQLSDAIRKARGGMR